MQAMASLHCSTEISDNYCRRDREKLIPDTVKDRINWKVSFSGYKLKDSANFRS